MLCFVILWTQEEIADDPLAIIAKSANQIGEWSLDLEKVLQGHSLSLKCILVDADKLRLSTLKELTGQRPYPVADC